MKNFRSIDSLQCERDRVKCLDEIFGRLNPCNDVNFLNPGEIQKLSNGGLGGQQI